MNRKEQARLPVSRPLPPETPRRNFKPLAAPLRHDHAQPRFGPPHPAYHAAKPKFGRTKPRFHHAKPWFGRTKPWCGATKPEFGRAMPGFDATTPWLHIIKPWCGRTTPWSGATKPGFDATHPRFGRAKPWFDATKLRFGGAKRRIRVHGPKRGASTGQTPQFMQQRGGSRSLAATAEPAWAVLNSRRA
uniref:hypothetical protein n=1 Tax=Prosthecobacter sp. TaxID=1965333 RepID=UPI0037837A48